MSWELWRERYLEEFCDRLRPRTQKAFRKQLSHFLDVVAVETPEHLQPSHLHEYLGAVLEKGRLAATAWGYLARLLRFFRWLVKRQVLLWDPTQKLVLPAFARSTKRPPTQTELLRLLESPHLENWAGQRDRALLEFFYGTGLRLGEVQALNLADVQLQDRLVSVREGKTGPRLTPMGPHLVEIMRDYLERVRPQALRDSTQTALWINAAGKRLTYAGLGGRIKRLGRRVDLQLSPHSLRHAYATHLVQEGAPLRWVQALLGHHSLLSTQTYTQLAPTDVLREFRRTHPRARRKRTRERMDRATPGPTPGPGPEEGDTGSLPLLPEGF